MLRFFEVWNPSGYHGWYQYATACAFYLLVIVHTYIRSNLYDAVKTVVTDTVKDFADGKGYEFVVDLVIGPILVAWLLCLILFSAFFWPASAPYMSSVAFRRWRQKRNAVQKHHEA